MAMNTTKVHHVNQNSDYSTEILNELGTTDIAVGDVTAEVMITTIGKIPNEMYYLEDTTPRVLAGARATDVPHEIHIMTENVHSNISTEITSKSFTGHPTLLLSLLIALLILLLLCCITACMIAKSKRKSNFFGKNDMECDPECRGLNQPLLNSETTSKTSDSSIKN